MHHVTLDQWSRGVSPLHQRDPRVKIVAVLVFLAVVATAHRSLPWLCAAFFVVLCLAARSARLPLAGALTRAGVVLPFTLVFAGVSWLAGDPARGAALVMKSYLSAFAVLLLVSTTPLPLLLRGFEMTGVPRFLLMVAQFLYRYLFVISEEAQHMRKAAAARGATARGLAGNSARFRAAAGALAVLFARSYARAGDIHRAMLSRGFPGYFRPLVELHFHQADVAFLFLGFTHSGAGEGAHRGGVVMPPLVWVQGLRYCYEDGTEALRGVDFSLRAGESVALLGANGSGKTTFALHLNGLLTGQGTVEICGLPVIAANLVEVRRKIGLVFQDSESQLFMPTVLEDVAFGPLNHGLPPQQAAERARRCLSQVGMSAMSGKAPYHLSAGEKKRVAIAGILAMEPEILVLDEPTTFLDPPGQRAPGPTAGRAASSQDTNYTRYALRACGLLARRILSKWQDCGGRICGISGAPP